MNPEPHSEATQAPNPAPALATGQPAPGTGVTTQSPQSHFAATPAHRDKLVDFLIKNSTLYNLLSRGSSATYPDMILNVCACAISILICYLMDYL